MKTLIALLLTSSCAFAQDFTASWAYHTNAVGPALGIAGSANIMTWNSRKVILRLGGAYFSGSSWSTNPAVRSRDRYELSFESKNTIITGRPLFNIVQLGYQFTRSRIQEGSRVTGMSDRGMFFGIGLGLWVARPVSISARYVTGYDGGMRLGMDYDF
jgi:hypothetical protein